MARRALACVVLLALFSLPASADASFEVRTVVKDFVTVEWTIRCPDGSVIDMTRVALTEEGYEELFDCLGMIESDNGLAIESHTKVRNGAVESDRIVSETTLTEAQAAKLCKIVEDHEIPQMAVFRGRPRIHTVLCDGVVESIVIDFGDGTTLDVTSLPVDAGTLGVLLALIAGFESTNGVHVTSETTIVDGTTEKDRVVAVTYLEPAQLVQIQQCFVSRGFQILPGIIVYPVDMLAVLKAGRYRERARLEGDVTVQRGSGAGTESDPVPIQIVSLDLVSSQPITVTIPSGANGQGEMFVPDLSVPIVRTELQIPLQLEIPALGFDGSTSGPVPFSSQTGAKNTGGSQVFRSSGRHETEDSTSGDTVDVKIQRMVLGLPGSRVVAPLVVPK